MVSFVHFYHQGGQLQYRVVLHHQHLHSRTHTITHTHNKEITIIIHVHVVVLLPQIIFLTLHVCIKMNCSQSVLCPIYIYYVHICTCTNSGLTLVSRTLLTMTILWESRKSSISCNTETQTMSVCVVCVSLDSRPQGKENKRHIGACGSILA